MAQWEVLDISSVQHSLDYDSIVNSDIDGVVLLLGTRNYATSNLSADIKLDTHYNELQGRTKLGYYWVTQALSEREAIEEAEYCHLLLGDKQCDFPIYIRSDWGNISHTGRADDIGRDYRTYYLLVWIAKMKELGHTRIGIYANDEWFRSKLLVSYLYEQNASMWVTRYGTYGPSYTTTYDGWNYTDEGTKGDNTFLSLSYFYNNVADWDVEPRININDLTINLYPNVNYYTGLPVEPTPIIEDLVIGEDFTVSYTNNINAGTAICTCDGINDFYGTVNLIFTIQPKSIEDMELELVKSAYEYTGTPIIPEYYIEGLDAIDDYTILCENNVEIGEATIYATGRGNYIGTISANYLVYIDEDMSTKTLIIVPERMTYNAGNPCCPEVSIIGLTKDVDYTISYRDNINVGNGVVVATGLGRYTGTKEQTFIIDRCHISAVNSYITIDEYTYTGEPIIPEVTVEGLVEGVDYRLEYSNNINAGYGVVTLYGLGNYFGDFAKYFTIRPKPLYGMELVITPNIMEYTGDPVKPNVSVTGLVYEEDYLVAYDNNIEVGTEALGIAIGRGNYGAKISENFTITKGRMEHHPLTFLPDRLVYTGRPLKPTPIIHGLVIGRDYMISYADNIDIGTASGTATGRGNYEGSITATFEIVGESIDDKELVLSHYEYIYNGEARTPVGTIEGLTEGTDFRMEYTNNINAGTATAKAIGIGTYAGTIEAEYIIKPKSIESKFVVPVPNSVTYDGSIHTPNIAINGLVRNVDYTVAFGDNINAGICPIYCQGIGNYTDMTIGEFQIKPTSIQDVYFSISPMSYTYDGTPKCPTEFTFSSLHKGEDYIVEYEDNINAGIATTNIIGIGNYSDTISIHFTITPVDITNDYSINYIPTQYYDAHNEPPVIIDGLVAGEDYDVEYENNTNIGIATAKAIGINNYTGTLSRNFTIYQTSIRLATVKLGTPTIYSKYRVDGPIIITYGDYTLIEGVDYELGERVYEDFGDFSLVTFDGLGKGNFNDGRTYRFRVIPTEPEPGPEYPEYYDADDGTNIDSHGRRKGEDLDFTDDELIDIKTAGMFLKDTVMQYNFGRELKPRYDTKLVEGYDFESYYVANTEVGTGSLYVLGINAYTGKRDFVFTILPKNITYEAVIECGEPDARGHYNVANMKVYFNGERYLVKDVEYMYSIQEIPDYESGILYAKFNITGIGNFTGFCSKTFDINSMIEDISYHTFGVEGYIVYNRDLQRPIPKCLDLEYGIDYKVIGYANNLNAGTATVSVAGIGNHTGQKVVEFTIHPASVMYCKVDIGEIVDEDYDHSLIKVYTANDILLNKATEVNISTYDHYIEDLKVSDVTVVGIGNYTDTVVKRFYLNDNFLDISKTDVHLLYTDFTYTGSCIQPIVTSRDRIEGIDYTITYDENAIAVGRYDVTIVGAGNYSNSVKLLSFDINQMPIKQCESQCGEPDEYGYYDPELFNLVNPYGIYLIEEEDYTVEISPYPNYETGSLECIFDVTGIGNYTGTATYTYEISDIPDDEDPINPEDAEQIKARVPVSLIDAPVYARSTSTIPDTIVTGVYLIYDSNIENNRVRVVKSKYAFSNPCMITGWVDLDDILKKNIPFQIGDKVIVTGTLYQYESGLGMQIEKNEEVMYITYYNGNSTTAFNYGVSNSKHTAVVGYCSSEILKHALLNEEDLNIQT